MIHALLNLTRPLFVLDAETTGVDPNVDRIVSLGFQRWTAEGMDKEWKTLVNPGVPIPASATKVHGITDEMMKQCQECKQLLEHASHTPSSGGHAFKPVYTFKQLAANLAMGLSSCDFAGKNVRFDLRITSAEMARAGVEWSYAGARIVDAERLEQLAVPRSLSHLYEKYVRVPCAGCSSKGWLVELRHNVRVIDEPTPELVRCKACNGVGSVGQKLEGAHDALTDVRASTLVIAGQLEAHASLPHDLDALHAAQWPGWIDGEGMFRFVDGVACFGGWGKYKGRPMKNADRGYWDFILSNNFPADVKALASAAKLGKFPEAKK